MMDQSLIVGDIVFASHRDRALYLGTSVKDRPRWLNENPGRWRRLHDVQQEGAPLRSLDESEITIGARRYAGERRVASMLGISPRTLSRWNRAGIGPPKIKIGQKIFYDLEKISEWLATREVPPTRIAGQN